MSSIWWWKEWFLWRELLIKQRYMRIWCSSFKRLFRMQVKMSPRMLKFTQCWMEEFYYRATLKASALSIFLISFLKCNWDKSHKESQKVPWLLRQLRWIQGEDLKRARVPYSQPLFYFIYLKYIIYIKGSAWLTSYTRIQDKIS